MKNLLFGLFFFIFIINIYSFGLESDEDLDGIKNEFDNCPNTLEGEPIDLLGCSQRQVDSDYDRVCNFNSPPNFWCIGTDRCQDITGKEIFKGCVYEYTKNTNDECNLIFNEEDQTIFCENEILFNNGESILNSISNEIPISSFNIKKDGIYSCGENSCKINYNGFGSNPYCYVSDFKVSMGEKILFYNSKEVENGLECESKFRTCSPQGVFDGDNSFIHLNCINKENTQMKNLTLGDNSTNNMIDILSLPFGSKCESDCVVRPNFNRYVKECRGVNNCKFTELNSDEGIEVANLCHMAKEGSIVKLNETHEIKCPNGVPKKIYFEENIWFEGDKNKCENIINKLVNVITHEGERIRMYLLYCG